MKFLVSPGFRHPSRIRKLLLSVVALLFVFNGFHALSFALQSPSFEALKIYWQAKNVDQIERPIVSDRKETQMDAEDRSASMEEEGGEEEGAAIDTGDSMVPKKATEKLRLAILEGLHIDLFVFSMQYLLLLSLYFQIEKKKFFQKFALHGIPVIFLLWLALRFLAPEAGLFWDAAVLGTGLAFYVCLQGLVLRVLYKIYFLKKYKFNKQEK